MLVSTEADLLPPWLRFVSLIVDSADVPLNVSRELVQKSPVLGAIRKAVVARILQELGKLAESDPAKYAIVWKNFGAPLKEGLYEEPERRDALFGLARFVTSVRPGGDRTLAQYVADLRPNQPAIYYLTGADLAGLAASPHLEGFRARGVEVLLLSDPVDAFWVSNAVGFEGKPFRSVTQGQPDIAQVPLADGQAEQARPKLDAAAATCIARMKEALGERVSDVRASDRLAESAACLVASDRAPDRTLAKISPGPDVSTCPCSPSLKSISDIRFCARSLRSRAPKPAIRSSRPAVSFSTLRRWRKARAPETAPEVARRLSSWIARALSETPMREVEPFPELAGVSRETALAVVRAYLRSHGIDEAGADARLLTFAACDFDLLALLREPHASLTETHASRLRDHAERRVAASPPAGSWDAGHSGRIDLRFDPASSTRAPTARPSSALRCAQCVDGERRQTASWISDRAPGRCCARF